MDPIQLGKFVRAIRVRLGWRQVDLAQRAGVAPNTVTGCETGRKTQRPKLEQIARALGMTYDALMRGEMPATAGGVPPAFAGLNDEDVAIARQYHDAPSMVRDAIRSILKLRPDRRADILTVVEAVDQAQTAAEDAEKRHHPPRTHNH